MHILKIVLEIIVVIASILLTLLILMHKGKGGGLSDMFGGGLTQNAGTSGVAEKNLNRWSMKSGTSGILTVQNIIRSAKTAVRISKKRSTTM